MLEENDREESELRGENEEHDEELEEDEDQIASLQRVAPTEQAATPRARDHSYLPGTSHPLMPESLLSSRKRRRSMAKPSNNGLIEVPLLVLPGVVLFPGTTLPIRLRHSRWREYLGRKIEESRRSAGSEEITLGVLTQVVPEVRQRSSWMRTGIDRRRSSNTVSILQNLGDLLEVDDDDNEEEEDESDEEDEEERRPQDPLIGRIGTMVTIINTHGDATTETNDWSRGGTWQENSNQLVVTALGTGRFRVAQFVEDGRGYQGIGMVRCYRVQELCDEELPLPPVTRPMNPTAGRHQQIINHLAAVSPIPKFVFSRMWPWKLVEEIQSRLDRVQSLQGLNKQVENMKKEPTAFSFWISANMPLKESEKLHLLKVDSTVERLRYIHEKVLELEKRETFVCCKMCRSQLSAVSNMFTIGGAEGTTGAYVNEHGIIHQTITLREVDEEKLWYTGRPEVRDSWFPGYSWTIAYCRYCHNHLGWKFLPAGRLGSAAVTDDRPEQFWGLSGSSVTTI